MGILIVNYIFTIVKTLLVVISVLIIYSLLMISVESKNFEIAVIRMVGMNKASIIGLVVCQSFLYVIPAMILAFGVSIIILGEASKYFEANYKVKIDRIPGLDSCLQGIFIGSVIPLISSIMPI